jgi:hypothetical protein
MSELRKEFNGFKPNTRAHALFYLRTAVLHGDAQSCMASVRRPLLHLHRRVTHDGRHALRLIARPIIPATDSRAWGEIRGMSAKLLLIKIITIASFR